MAAPKLGNSAKDSQYLKRIKDAIAHDKDHPRHQGIKMQAHHLISAEGMKRSGLGRKIEKYGYDINLLPNLAFIPCTLQGACHLGVQPHRGNHTALVDQDDYDDDMEPGNYHDLVARMIKELGLPLNKECSGDGSDQRRLVQSKLDKLSREILNLILKKPRAAPLTEVAKHFNPGNTIGCCGVDAVGHHKGHRNCPVDRNHRGRQGPGQKAERIEYESNGRYQIAVGR